MENKTDPYVGFDPTQMQGQGCCGEKVFDFQTGAWVVKKQPPTCEDLLAQSKEEKAKLESDLANVTTEKDQALQERDMALAKLAECEKTKADCPTTPVYSIGDKYLFDSSACGEPVSSIGGNTLGVSSVVSDTGGQGQHRLVKSYNLH